jgi:hypothetical protein
VLKGAGQAAGVSGLSLRLHYDPAILTYRSVEAGPVLTRAMIGEDSDSEADPGKVALGFVCTFKSPTSKEFAAVAEDGVILKVQFTVNAAARDGSNSPLSIENYSVLSTQSPPAELPVTIEAGEVTIKASALSGPWLWLLGAAGLLALLLLLWWLMSSLRGQSAAALSPASEPGASFSHKCMSCGSAIQLPVALFGRSVTCDKCGTSQTAG